jgi:hypothetical protein
MIRVSSGSAISIDGSGIDLAVEISGFTINGGGIYFYSAGGSTKTLNIYGNVITENQASAENPALANGGGIIIFDHSGDLNLTLSNNIITGNQADGGGGGLRVYTVFPDANIDIANNVFYGNSSSYGGAISFHVTGAGTLSADMTNNAISENSVTNCAGGLHFSALTQATASLDIKKTPLSGATPP